MTPKILFLLLLTSCTHQPTCEQAQNYCYNEYGINADKLTNAGVSGSFEHTYEMGAYGGCIFGIMEFSGEYQ